MKIRKSILLGSLVTILFLCATVVLTRRPRPVEPAVNVPERAEGIVQPPTPSVPVARIVPAAPAIPSAAVVDLPEVAREPGHTVPLSAGGVLARVNGRPIELKDLVPLEARETARAMTPEEYDSRLNRAIEMELTFQAAAAQGVDLTPEQKKRVDGLAQRQEATLQEYRKQGVTWGSVTPAQVEFEQRLTSALLLQQNLVAAEAHVAPASDAGVQARYEQARSEVLSRLKAQSNISVSTGEL